MEQYFMPIYTTLVGTVIGFLVAGLRNLIKKQKDEKNLELDITKALREGMAILLRRQLFEWFDAYQFQEAIPLSEWEEIEETYKVYHQLGGNHSGDRVYSALKEKSIGDNHG